jgi:hypothetical protein
MPWFQYPNRKQATLEAIEKTLREDFMERVIAMTTGLAECGRLVYREEGQTKAVVFDVQKASCVENQKEDWVITPAVASLSQKTDILIGASTKTAKSVVTFSNKETAACVRTVLSYVIVILSPSRE